MAEIISSDPDELCRFGAIAVSPFVKPIVEANRRGEPSPVASCVLVSFNNKRYVVTASHATSQLFDGTARGAFYTFVPERVQLTGAMYRLPDPYDITLIEIPMGRSLRLPDNLARDISSDEMCLFLGFPARAKAWKIDANAGTMRPTGLAYFGKVSASSAEQLTVRFDRKRPYRDGKRLADIGKLNGISGCGIFVFRNDAPTLAGVVIEYHQRRTEIVCTNSTVLWELVKQAIP